MREPIEPARTQEVQRRVEEALEAFGEAWYDLAYSEMRGTAADERESKDAIEKSHAAVFRVIADMFREASEDTARLDWIDATCASVVLDGLDQPIDDHPWSYRVDHKPWFAPPHHGAREAIDRAHRTEHP